MVLVLVLVGDGVWAVLVCSPISWILPFAWFASLLIHTSFSAPPHPCEPGHPAVISCALLCCCTRRQLLYCHGLAAATIVRQVSWQPCVACTIRSGCRLRHFGHGLCQKDQHNRLSPMRDVQDGEGVRRHGGCGCRNESARRGWAAGGRCFSDAKGCEWQLERADPDDC